MASRDMPCYIIFTSWFHYESFHSKMAEFLT
jgi:hypothetical protein